MRPAKAPPKADGPNRSAGAADYRKLPEGGSMKLGALKPTLGSIAPRLAYAQGDEKAQDKARNQLAPWRAWYKTTRWTKLRKTVLLRDLYTCQMCGRIDTTGLVVDHVKPHRGSEQLFWDERNLQVLCASPCHSKHKQAAERVIL